MTHEISMAIQKARQQNKMSQGDLAKELKCKESIIKTYENGTAIPSNDFIHKIELVLKTKLPRAPKQKVEE